MAAAHSGRVLLAVVLAVLAISIPVRGQSRSDQPTGTLGDRLVQQAARTGRARVIVGLRTRAAFVNDALLEPAERQRQRNDVARAQASVLSRLVGHVEDVKRFRVIPSMAMEVDLKALEALALSPEVEYIEEDRAEAPALADSRVITGALAAWSSDYTGAGTAIALLDTPIDTSHPFLGGPDSNRIVLGGCYSTSIPGASSSLCPVYTASPNATQDHGTHVAGILVGNDDTSTLPSARRGIAPAATLLYIQVFSRIDTGKAPCPFDMEVPGSNCLQSFVSDQILGLERVYELRTSYNIVAVNMSIFGGVYSSQDACDTANVARKTIIDTLRSVNIATVAAAGNGGTSLAAEHLAAPACISSAISVGSTTDGGSSTTTDVVSSFSNSAAFLDLLAPGEVIESSVPCLSGNCSLGWFAGKSGTSFAAPHVTGAWALIRSRFPSLSVTQVLDALTATGHVVVDSRNGIGFPRIDIAAALASLGPACTYAISPTGSVVGRDGGTVSVSLTTEAGCPWMAAVNNGDFLAIDGATAGTGPVTLQVAVAANPSLATRYATVMVGRQAFALTQAGQIPSHVPFDVNGDGTLDLLWHHQADGRLAAWTMSGPTQIAGTLLTPGQVSDLGWKVVGAGDVDGDGFDDMIWQHTDGRVAAWLMSGLTLRDGSLLSIPQVNDTDWQIRAVGDVNADRRADLLWQHRVDGRIAVWIMDGVSVVFATLISPPQVSDIGWKIVGMGDFDSDGNRDIVWHHQTDGRIAVWFMSGSSLISGTATNPADVPDTNWQIRGVGDLNLDAHPDLIWQHVVDGRLAVWLMDGLRLIDGLALTPSQVSDTNWHIVGPR